MHKSYLLIFVLLALFSCQQDPIDPNIILVPDNTAPPDLTVPRVIQENYVNKLYITLLGRKVTPNEMNAALATLDQNFTSVPDRKSLIAQIQADPDYYLKQYDFMRINLLSNLDTAEISQQIRILNQLYDDPRYTDFRDLITYEKNRLVDLRSAPGLFVSGNINRIDLHRRCVDNLFYDEINMGTQNFVLSMFESFLGRNPTTAEENAAILMVDGFESILFGEIGQSKEDFLDIFFSSNNYFEGQVIEIYEGFLFRSPKTLEMSEATISYKNSSNYQELIQDILSTDEYLGID